MIPSLPPELPAGVAAALTAGDVAAVRAPRVTEDASEEEEEEMPGAPANEDDAAAAAGDSDESAAAAGDSDESTAAVVAAVASPTSAAVFAGGQGSRS